MPGYLGYWKQEGLDVEVITTPGASAAIQLVISGKADAAVASPVTAMLAVQKGVDLKDHAYTTLRGDIFGVAIPAGKGINSLKDLKGHTIGVSSFASSGTNYTKSLLVKAGLQPSDFSVVEVGVGARAASALRSGQVQALGLWDEAYKQMELSGIEFAKIYSDPRAGNLYCWLDRSARRGSQEAATGPDWPRSRYCEGAVISADKPRRLGENSLESLSAIGATGR